MIFNHFLDDFTCRKAPLRGPGRPALDAFFRRALDPKRAARFHGGIEFYRGLAQALAD